MLVIVRHSLQQNLKHVALTGVTIGRRDVQMASVSKDSCVVNMAGMLFTANQGDSLRFSEDSTIQVTILKIYSNRVRIGIEAPSNIKIDRWDRKS